MSLVDGNSNGMVMPVGPMYGNGYGNGMFGADGFWVILFLFAMMSNGGWWGNGGGNNAVQNDVSRGFDNLALSNQISSLSGQTANGFDGQATREQLSGIQSAITNGFSSAEVSACNRAMNDMQATFNNQTAITGGLQNLSQQLANCCCQNQLATCQTNNTIVSQAAETRYQMAQNTRDIITNQTAVGQSILDKLCQMEIDTLKTANNSMASEIASLKAQLATQQQTQSLIADNSIQTATLINRIAPTPIPAYAVTAPTTTTAAA